MCPRTTCSAKSCLQPHLVATFGTRTSVKSQMQMLQYCVKFSHFTISLASISYSINSEPQMSPYEKKNQQNHFDAKKKIGHRPSGFLFFNLCIILEYYLTIVCDFIFSTQPKATFLIFPKHVKTTGL